MQPDDQTPARSLLKNSVRLGALALVTALLLALVQGNTAERIASQRLNAEREALAELFPPGGHDNDLTSDVLLLDPDDSEFRDASLLGLRMAGTMYIARRGDQVSGLIIPAIARNGYNGYISLLVAVNFDGTLSGVRVGAHRETPGLGDKIETRVSDWIMGFDGLSLENPEMSGWTVQKDGGEFDQFTGATVTPRAVIQSVKGVLQFFESNRQQLLKL